MRTHWIRVVAVVIATAAACASAASTALGAAGEVAYRCNNNDICLLDPDAPSSVVNLTFNGASSAEGYPFWSPDGSKVGFTSNFKAPNTIGAENLFTMDPNAPGQAVNLAIQLTTYTSGTAREAEWSPDGSKVAFTHGPGFSPGVFVVNSDGTTPSPVTLAAAGSGPAESDSGPSFSPDGTKVAYAHNEQIYTINADGTGAPQPLAGALGHSPVWSPDGTRIAYDVVAHSGVFVDVHIVRVDGTGTPVVIPLTSSEFSFARWSPDSSRIAFRDVSGSNGYFRVANVDGTGNHALAANVSQNDNQTPSWSPDAARLTFSALNYSGGSGVTEVHTVMVDGTGPDLTLTSGGGNADAIWRPAKPVVVPPGQTAPPGAVVAPPVQPPLPGPTLAKPRYVWITKRVPVQPSAPFYVLKVSCPTVTCKLDLEAKGSKKVRSGKRTLLAGEQHRAAKPQLLAKGSTTIPGGESRRVKAKLTRLGAKTLRKRGSLKLTFKIKSKTAGESDVIDRHVVRIYLAKRKGRGKGKDKG